MRRLVSANMIMPKSSVIKRMNFNNDRNDLTVEFKSGVKYVYTPVSEEFYNKLKNSTSKGRFFNSNIRNNEALTCLKFIK